MPTVYSYWWFYDFVYVYKYSELNVFAKSVCCCCLKFIKVIVKLRQLYKGTSYNVNEILDTKATPIGLLVSH